MKPQVFLSMQPTDHPRIEINGDLSSEGHQGSDMIYRTTTKTNTLVMTGSIYPRTHQQGTFELTYLPIACHFPEIHKTILFVGKASLTFLASDRIFCKCKNTL